MKPGPLVVGIGGTLRVDSSTERALVHALKAAEDAGARTRLFGGEFLERLPHFNPGPAGPSPEQRELAAAVREADGIILATPSYHGSLSGVVKNALDTLELTRSDPKPYFEGKPVGIIITADGAQAGGTTLMAVRGIVHAMRGWPTPYGATLGVSDLLNTAAAHARFAEQIAIVAAQVLEFARMRGARMMEAGA